jgi:hypothetical protein
MSCSVLHFSADVTDEDGKGKICSTHEGNKKSVQKFCRKISGEKNTGDLVIDEGYYYNKIYLR